MLHPFEKLDPIVRRRALAVMTVVALLATLVMGFIDSHYRTRAAPLGIVSFEMAGSSVLAQWILDLWSRHAGMNAWVAFGLGIDYLYLVIYGVAFSLLTASLAVRLTPISMPAAKIARFVAYLQLVAPICDAFENAGLMAMLARNGTEFWAPFATGFALVKFACLGTGVALALIAGPVVLRAGRGAPPITSKPDPAGA